MTQNNIISSISVFDYARNKLCDLYDSQYDLDGQAYGITFETNMTDGIKSLSFSIPYKIDGKQNFRWKFLKSEYLIRFIYDGKTEWFIAQKPSKHRDKKSVYGSVTCSGLEVSLKTKNIYKEFDDENGIGTIGELVDKILAGTGWHRGHTDSLLEADGTTEKIRSITSGNKQGALGLMTTVCNIFKCFPVYKSDTKTVELYNFNNRDQVLEGTIGINLEALAVNYNSTDIITRLYVEGEYEEDGYVGIDSANPTGLNYIFNFDYYKEIGVFSSEHEDALQQYLTDIADIKTQISAETSDLIDVENALNDLIGQCELVVYYVSHGYTTPLYIYGDPLEESIELQVGDDVVVVNSNGTYRYATIVTEPSALIQTGDYAIAKFITKAAGSLGANEVQVEAKDKQIANLERKKNATTKEDKIAEYNAEIAQQQEEIETIYTKDNGLYDQMDAVMKSTGLLNDRDVINSALDALRVQQDDIEADFIIAMGDMLRDGYWNDKNYIAGQEAHLLADAEDRLSVYSRPDVSYSFNIVRLSEQFGIPIQDFKLNAIFRVHDDELDVHDNLFVIKITIGVDDESAGNIEVSNKDITLNSNDLGALLSRMSQLSDLIEQKNTLYERAKAIQKNGSIYTDRLNGQIDVLKTQLLSTVSNWYTDSQGNIMFEAADGGSAMMLCGAGFMIANSRDDDDNWVWRTFGTGEGFTADEIVAGFISAERIEAGSISTNKVEPGFGGSLVITGNPSITNLNNAIANDFVENHPYNAGEMVNHNGVFYIFTNDFAGGTFEEALNYMSDTSVAAQIELMPDKIISMVEGKSYSRTYIQPTDPTLDPTLNVRFGDYWMRTNEGKNWGEVKMFTWQAIKTNTWGELKGYQELYCWDGTQWQQVSEHAAVASAFTRITQTQEMILQEAERSNAKYIARTTHYQDADSIVTTAQAYTDNKLGNYSTISQTAYAIETYVTNSLGDYSTTIQTQSMIQTTISSSLSNYYTKTETASQISTTISSSLSNYYTKSETASQIQTTISTSLSNYYTKTETASQIQTTISSSLSNYYTKTETASQIQTTISSSLSNYYTKTETDSKISTTISSSLSNYYTKTETASQISTTISSSLSNYYTKTETASQISTTISSSLSNYYTKSETASQISTTISSSLSNYYTKTETASQITATVSSAVTGEVSGYGLTAAGLAISGSKYIKLDVTQSNYVHITNSGIDVAGSRIKINGKEVWGRDDIIILRSGQTESSITHPAGDWVLIKPYYDSTISGTGKTGAYAKNIVISDYNISSGYAFGNGADWYQYDVSVGVGNTSSSIQQVVVTVFFSNKPFRFSDDSAAGTYYSQALQQCTTYTWSSAQTTIGVNNTHVFNLTTDHVIQNLCSEGSIVYYAITGVGFTGSRILSHTFTATTDAKTSKVPCTVYYYPPVS